MKTFAIKTPSKEIEKDLLTKIDFLTKPKGSLGKLEKRSEERRVGKEC